MTWDEIYEAADGKACGEWELKRKDTARYEVVCFVEDNFGINLETECENVEEEIDYYAEKYGIIFDEEGKIVDRFLVEDEIADISSEDLKEWCNSAAGIDNNMARTQKQIIKSTEEWLDERWNIANMEINKDNPYSADMQYYKGAIAAVEWLGYDWKREDGKHKLFK